MSPLFDTHLLNEQGIEKAKHIALDFDGLLMDLELTIGDDAIKSREFSIVKTKLEEASFYAKKAMAIRPENQKS